MLISLQTPFPSEVPLLGALAFAMGIGSLWHFTKAWRSSRRLRRAEHLWFSGQPAQRVMSALGPQGALTFDGGELGSRRHHLRGLALFALGFREQARTAFRASALLRLPFWQRWLLRFYFRCVLGRKGNRAQRLGLWLMKIAPGVAGLRQTIALQMLDADPRCAWQILVETVPLAAEDPLMLEELMTLGLSRLQSSERPYPRLGVQELHPELPYVFEASLDLLIHRHGDPRIPWDRSMPARHFALKGRHREAVALALSVPPVQRSQALWEVLVVSLQNLNDVRGVQEALDQGLELCPTSFRLWMERFYAAMDREAFEDGLEALRQARRLLTPAPQKTQQRYEWLTQRARYAQWIEKAPQRAWELLERIPPDEDGGRVPELRVQVLADLGRYEEAHLALAPLLALRDSSQELLLLEAEILAGLEAWEALLPYLEQHAETLREQADYWHLKGLALSHLHDHEGARERLEQAAHMSQRNIRFVMDAGHACMDLAEFERAEGYWRQALKLQSQSEEALIQLAETRRALHDTDGAKRLLRECLLHHPDSEEAQAFLAELEAN